ncbi:alpha/beta hydrolase [Pseudoalteromonas denitrificans]|uniref:Esterase/lipase n=1 Tax=Pseudoalteromonas denitrificans DSM 6059 TaxID=1123010 RepID=A0A1I1QIR6_9GAMM|nr:alpha/beta fold hydrolase [Pseudoalteromonas denitrificans]SFD19718.1 Esterase/lipase [Pseudoalteromonas denitrificans DSM 6059]
MPIKLSFYLILFTFSGLSFANNTCDNLISNTQIHQKLINQGTYRNEFSRDKSAKINFDYTVETPFSEYLAFAKKQIIQSNPRALWSCEKYKTAMFQQYKQNNTANVLNLISPYELTIKNNNKVIILIHGLTDTPYHFHDLSKQFYEMGFDVRTLLLPGHGTTPTELSKTSYKDWQLATHYIIENSKKDYEQVLLGGFSTGGALIFDYLQKNNKDDKIKAALFWSLGSEAKSSNAWLSPYLNYLPFLTWLDKAADIDFAKYESFPLNAAAQFYLLSENITDLLDVPLSKSFNIPFFAVSSDVDNTINSETSYKLFSKWQQKKETKNAMLSRYDENTNTTIALCDKKPCYKILDISHTGVTNAYYNPLYGQNSQYRNCSHYLSEPNLYINCLKTDTFGENHEKNTAQFGTSDKTMARLTFNPHFDKMLHDIKQFLKNNALLNKGS